MKRKITSLTTAIIVLCVMLFTIPNTSWGQIKAEGDTHDFSQTLQQLLNNNASIASINIAQQNYPVKKVTVSYRYNNTISNAVTMEVTVGGSSWGTFNVNGTGSNYSTQDFQGESTTGAIVIKFTNNTGSGTGHGTFYVNNVTLTEGPSGPYTVTYNDNEATAGSAPTDPDSPYASGSTVTVLAKPETLAKTGHTFGGWNTKADGTGTNYTAGSGTFTITANTTLYAKWVPNTHTITFTGYSHGTPSADVVNASAVAYGTTVTLSYEHNNGEYYSASFSSTDVDIVNNQFTMPDKNVSITVTESALPVYTVTYSDGGSVTEEHYGAGVTLATRTGDATYTFAGWSATNIPSETTTVPTIIPTNVTYHPTSNITLYPVYTRTEGSGYKWVKTALADVTAGTYALITTDGHAFSGSITKGHGDVTSNAFSFTNNETTTAPSGLCELTLTVSNSTQFKMYNADKGYLYAAAASSGNLAWQNSESSYWKLSSSNWVYNSNTAYLRSYDNGSFRTYSSSSNGDVLLMAKKVSNTTTYYVSTLSSISVPSFDPTSQNFSTVSLDVTITVADGCVISYTTDNTDPESSGTATLTDTNSETVTVTSTTTIRALAFDGENYSSEVSQTYTRVYEVTLSSNGVAADPIEVTSGQTTTLTAPSNIPAGYSFRGWTATPSTPSTLVSTTYGPTANVTLYAVFGQNTYGDFKKVTSAPSDWSGYYLIVYETNNIALDGSLSDMNVSKNTISVTITTVQDVKTISSDATTNASKFAFSAITGGYSIRSASGKYIGRTANSNGIDQHATTAYLNTISYSSGTTITSSAGPTLQCWYQGGGTPNWKIQYYSSTQNAIQLYKQEVTSTDGYYTRVYPSNATATGDINVSTSGPIVIESGSTLNMSSYTLTCTDPTKLIIEDGAQLIYSTSVAATVKKKITAPTPAAAKDGDVYGWYTISSPVHTGSNAYVTIGDETTVNLTTGSYDMFAYDEATQKWINRKSGGNASGFNEMYKGQGYIYRNSGNELSFVGNTNVDAIDCPLTKASTGDLAGFNLIGNPYTHSITKGKGKAIDTDDASFTTGFFVLEDNAWVTYKDGDEIKANQGVLVKVTDAAATFQIKDVNYVAPAKSNGDNIKFIVSNGQFKDVSYALFDKGIGLDKINHRSPEVPMLYINQDGQDYAIATMSDDTKAFNLNFKAGIMSKYTLSFNANDHFNYLHLIDLLTGEDIDMLLEKEYSFIATPNDKENRFIVKLGYNAENNANNDIFAYQNGNDIVVEGEGELQVFDVTGRMVKIQRINGVQTINLNTQGVYIFKLNDKVQKVVVR